MFKLNLSSHHALLQDLTHTNKQDFEGEKMDFTSRATTDVDLVKTASVDIDGRGHQSIWLCHQSELPPAGQPLSSLMWKS